MTRITRGITRSLTRAIARSGVTVGTNYYVSATGSDANAGTSTGAPWLSITKVNASTFVPGDTVSFKGGDTFAGAIVIPSSGSSSLPITFNSYGTGQGIISATSGSHGITSTDKEYLTIDNLKVTGVGAAAATGDGIRLFSTGIVCHNLTVQNCLITAMPGWGIYILGATNGTSGLVNPQVLSCTTDGNTLGLVAASAGVCIGGGAGNQSSGSNYNCTGAVIRACISINNAGKAGASSWNGSGIFAYQMTGGVIEDCLADNNGALGDNSAGPTGIWCANVNGLVIQRNTSSNTKSAGGDGGGYDLDVGCSNCIVQNNISYGNVGYGFMAYEFDSANYSGNVGNVIRFNISYNDLLGGCRIVSGGTTPASGQIYCNTFQTVTSGSPMKIEKFGGSLTYTIANNNFVSSKSGTTDIVLATGNPTGCTFAGNNYYTPNTFRITWNSITYATLALWKIATGQEAIGGGIQAAPIYIGTAPYLVRAPIYNAEPWRPDEASTVLNAGVDLLANFSINMGTADFYGSAVSTAGPYSVGHAFVKSALKSVVVLASTTQTIPADYVSLYAVDCVAGGAGENGVGAGAGAGAFARITSTTTPLVAGVTGIQCVIGAAGSASNGGDTCWNASSLANAVSLGSAVACAAEGGKTNVTTTGGIGGLAANSVGTVKWSGGSGGNLGVAGSGGGGGAAGADGTGRDGAAGGATGTGAGGGGGANGGTAGFTPTVASRGGAGGGGPYNAGGAAGNPAGVAGTNGAGGSGAAVAGGVGGAGGAGVDWRDSTSGLFYGSGGGGGSAVGAQATTNVGGAFGGGGGGRVTALGGIGGIRFLYHTSFSA